MEIHSLSHAMQLHAHLVKQGCNVEAPAMSPIFSFAALSPSGCITYARSMFNSFPASNSYFFNTLLRSYASGDDPQQALRFYVQSRFEECAVRADNFTYPFLIKSCSRLRAIGVGRQLHGLVFKSCLQSDRFVQNSLIHMYCCCGKLGSARVVFDGMQNRDVVSWTSIIDGYVDCDRSLEALQLFEEMLENDVSPNDATIVSVLKACADAGAIGIGERVGRIARELGLDARANVVTALIDMYGKCGSIDCAKRHFERVRSGKDVFQWTAMISALASHGRCREAIDLFDEMEGMGIRPDDRTITAVLSACRNAGWIGEAYNYFDKMEKIECH